MDCPALYASHASFHTTGARALILRRARRAIKKSERLHDPSGLYDTLKRAMIEYCDLPPESSEDAVTEALQQQGYDDRTWQALVHEVVHYTEYTQGGRKTGTTTYI